VKLRNLLIAVLAITACGPKSTSPTSHPAPNVLAHVEPEIHETPLALWPAVKHGVLPNGLTYYVLAHAKPEKRAMLWLAVDAGAVQEDDDQRGLAHFVEHMSFNGTKRFPKQAIVNYVESIGVKFGPDLNAYTSFDETVYQLQVPTDDPKLVSTGLDILHDWAGDATFDPAEVDKERGVVLEEWRLGRGVQGRLLDKLIELVFGSSRYAKRIPIGLPDIIKKASRDTVVRFYKDWYRPDLMAVIAVGDFADAAAVEKEIVAKFGDIPKAAKSRQKQPAGVPEASGTKVAIETDKELPISVVGVGNLVAHRPSATATDFHRALSEQLYQLMLNERMQSIGRRSDAPFANGAVIIQKITREVDAFARFAIVKNDDAEGALRSLFAEILRVERHGFTQSELDRARAIVVRNYEQAVAEAATQKSRDLTTEIVRNFLEHEFMVGPEAERDLATAELPKITLAELNTVAKRFGGPENRVILLAGPDGKPQPTKARVLAIVDEVSRAPTEPWKDIQVATELMTAPAWPGTVAKESKNEALGTTEWMLANGVRVIVKPTDYEQDSVKIVGSSPGGLAVAAPRDFGNARFAAEIAVAGGVGALDADALGKALAGKHVSVSAEIGDVHEAIEGSGSVRDLETMMQLIYLRMTAPRRDPQAFEVWKTNLVEALTNQARSPDVEFAKRSQDVMWQGNVRRKPPEPGEVKQVDLDKALAFYSERFANGSDFTFVIVGAVDLAKLRPLVEAYLGTLPSVGKKEKELDIGARRVPGIVKKTWNLGIDQDKAHVQLTFHGDEPWSRDKERDMLILGQVVSIRLREVLREDMSGVYGVGAGGSLARSPRQERVFSIQFGCAPDAVDKLVTATFAELAAISKSGIGTEYLDKVKQTFIRERETAMRTNQFWVDSLERSARFGDDPATALDPAPVVARIASDNVKAAATRYLDRKRVYQAVMLPAAKTP
jgi:zinc protease